MAEEDRKLFAFAKELAKYSTSAERSNNLIFNIGRILGRKLNRDEEFKLRINIEIFIALTAIYTASCLNVDENKKKGFLSWFFWSYYLWK